MFLNNIIKLYAEKSHKYILVYTKKRCFYEIYLHTLSNYCETINFLVLKNMRQ